MTYRKTPGASYQRRSQLKGDLKKVLGLKSNDLDHLLKKAAGQGVDLTIKVLKKVSKEKFHKSYDNLTPEERFKVMMAAQATRRVHER